ncbi:unnamed protein product [Cylindrotheca closterium]|uniref:TLC domain-containing protein n=1 Tax=Cylindrotheca closterium TaxID=2856 RepID=A0AAD2CTX0_9STRA|nr:unnamed protein product [Cylindrotheca closterium]
MSSKGDSTSSDLPLYGRIVRGVYKCVPEFNLPGTSLPISFVSVSTLFFITIRILGNKFLEAGLGWPENSVVTDRAASSIPSVFHSTLLCPGLIVALLARKYVPSEHLSKGSEAWQDLVNALLQFCTGYMVNDTIFLIYRAQQASGLWIPPVPFGDKLFLGHHFVTSLYMTQARGYKAGHMSAMMCMLLGELSNPFHNLYYIFGIASELECCYGPMAQSINSVLPAIFASIYVLLRVVAAPPAMLYTTYDLLTNKEGKESLPFAIRFFWVFMIWAVIFGSIPEIITCKGILEEFMTRGAEQEL